MTGKFEEDIDLYEKIRLESPSKFSSSSDEDEKRDNYNMSRIKS